MNRSYFIRAVRTPAMEVLGACGVATLIWFLGRAVAEHTLDAAHVASFAVAMVQMYDPIKKLGHVSQVNPGSRRSHVSYIAWPGNQRSNRTHRT